MLVSLFLTLLHVTLTTIGRSPCATFPAQPDLVPRARQVADHLSNMTGPERGNATQNAFLSNAYMVGAAFTHRNNMPTRLVGVQEVPTGEGGEGISLCTSNPW